MGKFKDLKVWQKSKNLAVRIYKMTNEGKISKDFELKNQIRKSAVSIPSNIAEGDELDTDKQLIIAFEIEYLRKQIFDELEKECSEISAMLTKLIKHRSN